MRGRLRLVVLVSGVLLFIAGAASAQQREVSGGYSFLRESRTDIDFVRGWAASAAQRLGPIWVVVEADGHHSHQGFIVGSADVTLHGLLAGGRAKMRFGRFEEFVQVAGGRVWGRGVAFGVESRAVHAVAQLGVGIDAALTGQLRARLQVDVRSLPSARWKLTQSRASAGAVYVFR